MKTSHLLIEPGTESIIKPREYTQTQLEDIKILREYARSLQLPADDSYAPWEQRWLDWPDCCGRYMRAGKWKMDDAKRRIKATMEWRRAVRPDLIKPEDVRVESETGKMERAIEWMPPGQDSLVILVDYASCTLRTNPSIGTANKVLNILQQHYVERLGRAIVVNLPILLTFFYKGISPFLDPVTKEKMRFNPNLLELIPIDHLDAQFGGKYDYEFEPVTYWKELNEYV
ncbi:hypothetical protein Clacol_007508 [Clathrus columnatus]|uniref:CRAL-TRIO domain-containing protein n=1 Tax=Clathrus columnatus TaxID=1419009 RepID=A0AAV5AHW5_9AGAM|nr:hypothetical protein Clacol_007508 [Clathrus columnatus]